MTRLKPEIDHRGVCPYCRSEIRFDRVIWQGIHVCGEGRCATCAAVIAQDLPTGHALVHPYQVDLKKRALFGNSSARGWFGEPLLTSLLAPRSEPITVQVERFVDHKRVVLLNCLDAWYGHALLKLLYASHEIAQAAGRGVVVIVPVNLRWMVPPGVAEVWTVEVAARNAQCYYPALNERIAQECARFDEIYLSAAFPHPRDVDVRPFTQVEPHDFASPRYRISYVWREDRIWMTDLGVTGAGNRAVRTAALAWQNAKVRRLFGFLRDAVPDAVLTVIGLGHATAFPVWVDDRRVSSMSEDVERELCRLYADSRLVIGMHGSHMLLPSAHAGMTIDLMPADRWGNFAQDILYQEQDARMAAFRYRYLPLNVNLRLLARIAKDMIGGYTRFRAHMMNEYAHG